MSSHALVPAVRERLARVNGSFRDPRLITEHLHFLDEHFNLVAPATSCGSVPEGCAVVFSAVAIDIANETYDVGGKRGLGKVALERISSAAGISWDLRKSGRLDDGSDPYYCAWTAVGYMKHLDGSEVELGGTKEMDLRAESPQIEALFERYKAKLEKWHRDGRRGDAPKSPEGQIREMRLHILGHAESKARLRAIRSIGVRSAYDAAELRKPFVVAKLMWTGQTNDPELRRIFALKQQEAMIGGARALYGAAAPPPAALPRPSAPKRMRPPPVGTSAFEDDEDEAERPSTIDVPAAPPTPRPETSARVPQGGAPAPAPAPAPAASGERPRSGVKMKFGRAAGLDIEDAADGDLEWYSKALTKSIEDPEKARYRRNNESELAAIRAELAHRRGRSTQPSAPARAPAPPPQAGDYGDGYGGEYGDDEIPF